MLKQRFNKFDRHSIMARQAANDLLGLGSDSGYGGGHSGGGGYGCGCKDSGFGNFDLGLLAAGSVAFLALYTAITMMTRRKKRSISLQGGVEDVEESTQERVHDILFQGRVLYINSHSLFAFCPNA